MLEMQGQVLGAKAMRISGATPKKTGITTSTSVSVSSVIPSVIPSVIAPVIPSPAATLTSPPLAPVVSLLPSPNQAVDQNDPTNTTVSFSSSLLFCLSFSFFVRSTITLIFNRLSTRYVVRVNKI
jgi:hypothetical protein